MNKNRYTFYVGDIIFVVSLYDEGIEKIKQHMNENDIVNLEYKKEYKGRAFILCKIHRQDKMIYGFEIRSQKPKYKNIKFFPLEKKNGKTKYIYLNKLCAFKMQYILSDYKINRSFVLNDEKIQSLAIKLFKDYIYKKFIKD